MAEIYSAVLCFLGSSAMKKYISQKGLPAASPKVSALAEKLFKKYPSAEGDAGISHLLYYDNCSKAYYIVVHLKASALFGGADLEAVLTPEETEEYKLNRDIYIDNYAYQAMQADAVNGRSFEDIVVEFDPSYRPDKPLKVFGGQHRVTAIGNALKTKRDELHGVRIYLGLNTEQRLEIAKANNTAIAVANDLLDRMQEEFLGAELRNWSQSVGLLPQGQNFSDRRNSEGIPTVRIARTLVTNFHIALGKKLEDFHKPLVCSSGPDLDEAYKQVRLTIKWDDPKFLAAGKEFARLYKIQRERVLSRKSDKYAEYANKVIHPSVTSAWAYVAGLLQVDAKGLAKHYGLPESVSNDKTADPLAAVQLSKAKLKGVDPDNYRGLGARISPNELGRMLEVFLLQATKATKPGINLKLANAAIQSFEAKKQAHEANKAIKGI